MRESRRKSSCEGKHRFESFEQAQKVARLQSARKDTRISAYRCPVCRGFHTGQGTRKPKRRKHEIDEFEV